MIAIDPNRFGAGMNGAAGVKDLFAEILKQEGTRLPGDRRLANRKTTPQDGITVPDAMNTSWAAAGREH